MVCSSGGDKIRSGLDTFRGRVGIRHDSPDLSKKRRQLYFWQLAVRLTFRRFTSTWERVKRDELVCTQASGALIPDRVSAQEHGIWAYRSAKSIHQGMFSSRQFACTGPPSSRSTHRTWKEKLEKGTSSFRYESRWNCFLPNYWGIRGVNSYRHPESWKVRFDTHVSVAQTSARWPLYRGRFPVGHRDSLVIQRTLRRRLSQIIPH